LDISHVIILAIVQGLTEFLPVSSSAHLVLIPQLLGWEDQGLAFDVALHVGTLIAVFLYFRQELKSLLHNWATSCVTRQLNAESRLVWGIGIATIPAAIVGLLVSDLFLDLGDQLRNPTIIATTTIIFGFLLWWADATGQRQRDEYSLSIQDIFLIGLAQAIAILPGTSRSGITITIGLFLGLERRAAARFSFLLSIPAILLAALDAIIVMDHSSIAWSALIVGLIVSTASAYLCIWTFISLLNRMSLLPFVIYRFILGTVLWIWIV